MPTIHNEAKKDEIAEVVLMPGDPMRAKYIAENFLKDAVCVNKIRAMYAYTGEYNGKRITVMGSGMGIPSMGIYSYELYKFYGVKKIIRIGSCGAYDQKLNLLDTILVDNSYSTSSFAEFFRNSNEHIISASKNLNKLILNVAKKSEIELTLGNVFTSEVFDLYTEDFKNFIKKIPTKQECIAAEMESYALFNVAESLGREAACMLTVVDNVYKEQSISAKDREVALNNMIKLALEVAIK